MSFQHTAARRRLEITKAVKATNGMFQHTAARRRLEADVAKIGVLRGFQHTAARRRLVISISLTDKRGFVSTHSRPKAAG
nr:MAG TPA: hypothetical protein [Herelleviridae sp.]